MCTERVVPLGIPNDYCNWTFHLDIKDKSSAQNATGKFATKDYYAVLKVIL